MADNTRLSPGTGGDLMRSIEKGAAKAQVVVLDLGGAGAETLTAGSIPVTLTSTTVTGTVAVTGPLTDAQLRASAVPVSGPLTDAQLRATAVPVSGTFFQATQPVSFTWAGLTDAELRATAVPVSAASLPLPTGAATETTLAAIEAKLPALSGGSQPVVGPLTDVQLRASPIDVEPGPAALSSYNVAGVIAINTVLLTLDCSQHRSVSVQCVSMGTTGVVTPEWSNNNSTWVAATMFTAAGASATTFNAAGLWRLPVMARYLRLRLSTATTAGTTTLEVHRFESEMSPWLATQPVSGTVTATVTSTRITPNAADGHSTYFHLISAASTNDTLVLTGARAIGLITATNTNAAARYLKVYNKATAPTSSDTPVMTILLPPGQTTVVGGNSPIRVPLGLGIRLTTGIAVADTGAVAASEHAVSIAYT